MAIAAGGTAGHVTAGLAIADAYRALRPDVSLLFLGTRHGLEGDLVRRRGLPLALLPGSPLARQGGLGRARALANAARGALAARALFRRHGTQLLIGLGGYASAGPLLAARSQGIPSVIHESNAVPGIVNRRLARGAERIYVGCAAASERFETDRALVTRNPLRPEIASLARRRRVPPDPREPARILVLSGSTGSGFLDREAPELLAAIARRGRGLLVRHQTGHPHCGEVRARYAALGLPARVESYVEDIAAAYAEASFAISCAGALTLAELAAAGLPCLLVPLQQAAGNHQTANAVSFAHETGCLWSPSRGFDRARLADRIAGLLGCPAAWREAAQRMRSQSHPEAAHTIVADCEALVAG